MVQIQDLLAELYVIFFYHFVSFYYNFLCLPAISTFCLRSGLVLIKMPLTS